MREEEFKSPFRDRDTGHQGVGSHRSMDIPAITIREALPEERTLLGSEIAQPAWLDAFRHLLPVEAMRAHFDGTMEVSCDYWSQRGEKLFGFVAEAEGQLIGLVTLGNYADGDGEIRALYVAPAWQGKQVGKRLWEHAMAAFASRGTGVVHVWTLAGAASCRFYETMGCEPMGTGNLFLGPYSATCMHYRKEL